MWWILLHLSSLPSPSYFPQLLTFVISCLNLKNTHTHTPKNVFLPLVSSFAKQTLVISVTPAYSLVKMFYKVCYESPSLSSKTPNFLLRRGNLFQVGTSGTAQHPSPTDYKDCPASPELGRAVILTGMVEWRFWFPRNFFSQWPLGGSTSPGI